MKKNSKKLFLNNTAIETRRTTSKTAGGGLANYAIELGQWIENRIKDNTIKVGEQHVVDDIATRDDLFDVTKGDVAYVVDASADANVGSGAALYVYDGSDWKRIAKFESLNVTSSNITEGTLNPATTDRTVDMGTFDLDVTGTGHKTLRADATGNVYSQLRTNGLAASIGTYNTGSSVAVYTTDSLLKLDANGSAEVTLNKLTGNLHLYSYSGNYKLGATPTSTPKDLDSLTTPVYGLQINSSTGDITKVNKDAQFLADSQINPAISGHPTNAEIMTFLTSLTTSVRAGNLGRFFYYTGTDSPVDDYTHAYYMTGDGLLFEISSSEISNITEGTLNPATTDRTVDLGGNSLTVTSNDGSYFGNYILNSEDFEITTSQVGAGGDVVSIFSDISSSSLLSLYSRGGNYRVGTTYTGKPPMFNNATTAPYSLAIDNDGYIKYMSTEAVFISDSALNPSIGGHPTVTEVRTHIVTSNSGLQGNYKNRYIYYTGTDTATDTPRYTYFFTGTKQLLLVQEPMQKLYSLPVGKGGQVLTFADNGITGDVVSIVDFWDKEHTRLNFKFSWDATPSTGSCDIIVRADFNNTIVYQTTIADMSQAGGHFGVHTSNNIGSANAYSSWKGFYVELTNITGNVHNFSGSFIVKEGK